MSTKLIGIVVAGIAYYIAVHTAIGAMIFGPIEVLVAFLHEFGHAIMAVITRGEVASLQVNPDGSGVTGTYGGNRSLILMGGYIGSCVFSNLLIRFSLSNYASIVCYILAVLALFCGFHWFSNLTNLIILFGYAIGFVIIGRLTLITPYVLQFIGIACVIHILQDFQVGPSSDLEQFTQLGILPYTVWMYLWLIIAGTVTFFNLRYLRHG